MIKALLDQGLPRSSVAGLIQAGWDAVHVADIGMSQASDKTILHYAAENNRFVITLDADFHALLAVSDMVTPSVLRIRREGLQGQQLANLLLEIWPRIAEQMRQGAMVTVTERTIRIRHLPISSTSK